MPGPGHTVNWLTLVEKSGLAAHLKIRRNRARAQALPL